MHEALTEALDRADQAIASARTVVAPDSLESVARTVDDARARLLYPAEVLVVALAGGTGSGKSSLFNLLTGTDAATVGVSRPTTSEGLAGIPARYPTAFDRFLDDVEVRQRVVQEGLASVCLIDLPDTDSVEVDHRQRVEAIMPKIDVMVWVVDPEKYRDAALHHRYLQPLSDYSGQFIVVLNQIDRIPEQAIGEIHHDLERALMEDGIEAVPIIHVAAAPPAGPPVGIEQLKATIAGMTANRRSLFAKLVVDLDRAAKRLGSELGSPVGYRDEVGPVVEEATRLLLEGDRNGASDRLNAFLTGIAEQVPGPTGDSLRRVAATMPGAVHGLEVPEPAVRRWWRKTTEPDPAPVVRSGIGDLLRPVEELLRVRAGAIATTAEFALAVASIRGGLDR